MVLALLHEYAHYICHKTEKYDDLYDYQQGELHAESVAFIVAKFLGVENPFSKDYIINWKGNSKLLKEHLSLIDKVSSIIIDKIEEEVTDATKEPVQQTG